MSKRFSILVAIAAASQLGSTDCGNALRDPGYDLWCGDQLCAWTVDRGTVMRVATWNEGDYGVDLVDSDTQISQLSPVSSDDSNCLEFEMIADIDDDAQVTLGMDVFGDGTTEFTSIVPATHWKPVSFRVVIGGGRYRGIRFSLAKTGFGHARLANIGAHTQPDCTVEVVHPEPAPNGAPCDDNTGCKSGRCGGTPLFQNVCVGCDGGAGECANIDTCGLVDPGSPVRGFTLACETDNSRQLGEACLFGIECASTICTNGACSTCKTDNTGCTGGETCGPGYPQPTDFAGTFWRTPWVCSPGQHKRLPGEPCAEDDDCASNVCGTAQQVRQQCDDGRACSTAADCPFGGPDTMNGLQNGPCYPVGVQGGTCQ